MVGSMERPSRLQHHFSPPSIADLLGEDLAAWLFAGADAGQNASAPVTAPRDKGGTNPPSEGGSWRIRCAKADWMVVPSWCCPKGSLRDFTKSEPTQSWG